MTKKKMAKEFIQHVLGESFSFAMVLRALRTQRDLSQQELATLLGISVSHVSDLENGRKFVSVERAYEFAKILKESEKFFVAVALQDQVNRAELDFKVEIA